MKIVFNTNYQDAGTKIFVEDLSTLFKKEGHNIFFNDWGNYEKYDLALFMAPDSDVESVKKHSPQTKTGIMDPKVDSKKKKQEIKMADFLIVGSVEARDFFLKYNKNIFIYYGFPDIALVQKEHKEKDKIIIGYHGNKLHLNHMYPRITGALDELSDKYDIEFWAMYNITKLGKWEEKNTPQKVKIKHIQWSEENYYKYLAKCDIGIVPNNIPINMEKGRRTTKLFKRFLGYKLKYDENDYLLRFKYTSNNGRIYVFSQLGIPVVADLFPSAAQVILHGYSGFLSYSKEGWYDALEKLIISPELRNQFSNNLKNFIDSNMSIDKNFKKLQSFLTQEVF